MAQTRQISGILSIIMQAIIKRGRESSILYEGRFYDTGVPIDVTFSEAMRLTRVCEIEIKNDSVNYDPSLFKEEKFFNFMGDVETISGFGGCSYNLLKYSIPEYQISLVGRVMSVRDYDIGSARSRPVNQAGAMVWHDQPRDQWLHTPFQKNICIIPWETTVIPHSWIGKINGFDALFTTCKENIEAFRNSGVKIPIELIHWGVEPKAFYPLERNPNRPFTFGTMGVLTERKGTDLLLAAFKEEFPRENVRLLCKTSSPIWPFPFNDDRIKLMTGQMTQPELMTEFFSEVDCFVFPTRGEGFGLTPLEAMATGIPAIVTGWSGPMEYMTPEVGWTIDSTLARATPFTDNVYHEECGNWAEPSKEHLKSLMRYAYEHQEEVKKKGEAAAKYVQEQWLWKDKIHMFHEALAEYL